MSNPVIPEEEEKEIYRVISDSLLCLCEQKPNDPIDFLSRKMFELIGDDPNKAVRKKKEQTQAEKVQSKKTKQQLNREANVVISGAQLALNDLDEKFEAHYKIQKKFGKGCYYVTDIKDEKNIKVLRRLDKKKHKAILGEKKIKFLSELEHSCINKVHMMFDSPEYISIVEDYCPGGDLGTFLFVNKDKITLDLIKTIIKQILEGLVYLHNTKHVIHKYLNFKQILIFNPSLDPKQLRVKISGFIHAESYIPGKTLNDGIDFEMPESSYIAPEYFEKRYDNKVDIWCLGVMVYSLLVGKLPYEEDTNGVFSQVTLKEVPIPKKKKLKPEVADFIRHMLAKNISQRYSAEELLKSSFFGKEDEEFKVDLGAMNLLSGFKIGEMLRRSVLTYIMSKKLYDESNIDAIKTYEALDADHSGSVSIKELYTKCQTLFGGKSARKRLKQCKKFMEVVDINRNGEMDYAEFLTIMTVMNNKTNKQTLKNIFDYYDLNKTGFIEASGLKELFETSNITDEEIHQMLDDYDKNKDRKISFDEFLELVLFDNKPEDENAEKQEQDSEDEDEEKKDEAPKEDEKKDEAPKDEEKKDEAPKEEEKKDEAPKEEEKKNDAPKEEDKKDEGPKEEEKKE